MSVLVVRCEYAPKCIKWCIVLRVYSGARFSALFNFGYITGSSKISYLLFVNTEIAYTFTGAIVRWSFVRTDEWTSRGSCDQWIHWKSGRCSVYCYTLCMSFYGSWCSKLILWAVRVKYSYSTMPKKVLTVEDYSICAEVKYFPDVSIK